MPRAVCAPAMTLRFTEVRCAAAHMGAALQGIFVGQGPRALPGSAEKLGSGRCRHRPLRSVTRGTAKRAVEDAGPYGHFIVGAVGRATVRVGPAVCGKYRGINTGTDCEVSVRTGFAMTLHKDHGAWRRKIAQAGLCPACAHNLMRFIWADQSRRTAVPLAVTISMPLSAPRTS